MPVETVEVAIGTMLVSVIAEVPEAAKTTRVDPREVLKDGRKTDNKIIPGADRGSPS